MEGSLRRIRGCVKKTILTTLQVVVTVAILVWLFHDPKKRADIFASLRNAQLSWVIAGFAAYGLVEILAAARWQILLRVQGVRVSSVRLCSLLMIGIFFNQFMPGGTGGDVVKIFYLLKETPGKKTQAVLAALMDRLIGLVGLIFVAGVLIIWRWDWLTQNTSIPAFHVAWLFSPGALKDWLGQIPDTAKLLYILLAVLGASVLGIGTSFVITGLGLVDKLPAHFPKRDIFVDLSIAYNAYASAWKSSLAALFISFGVHLASFLVFFCAARSLAAAVSFLDLTSVMPIINTLSSLPISVGGTGPREGMFQTLLNQLCGLSKEQAVAVSLTGFIIILFWGVIGGVIYLFYRPSEHAKLSEIQDAVHKIEHEIAKHE